MVVRAQTHSRTRASMDTGLITDLVHGQCGSTRQLYKAFPFPGLWHHQSHSYLPTNLGFWQSLPKQKAWGAADKCLLIEELIWTLTTIHNTDLFHKLCQWALKVPNRLCIRRVGTFCRISGPIINYCQLPMLNNNPQSSQLCYCRLCLMSQTRANTGKAWGQKVAAQITSQYNIYDSSM